MPAFTPTGPTTITSCLWFDGCLDLTPHTEDGPGETGIADLEAAADAAGS